ncbi:MAG: division plane positioning ATPase MipZ [Pseudomonadota bacterium]
MTPNPATKVIVVGNEKGGAGKSTVVIHLATALLHMGSKVAVLDLDLRQQSVAHFFHNRRTWASAAEVVLPMPLDYRLGDDPVQVAKADAEEALARFETAFNEAVGEADYIIIDTPGADTALSRAAHAKADLIITPMNDSFVDFDMLGQVDPVTLDLIKPSLYAEAVWEARKRKMMFERKSVDWLVLRNRLASTEARNRKRLEERVDALAKRVGFRVGPGMRDRVIYRELFPFGVTVIDLSTTVRPVPVALSHVAARQELRALMQAVGLAGGEKSAKRAVEAVPNVEPLKVASAAEVA